MSKKFNQQLNKYWDVIVVGGGAAGLMAAIHAARAGAQVLILEHMERPGKKLLMTGNGKCNLTNEALLHFDEWQDETACEQYYHGSCPAFVLSALKKFDIKSTLNFFEDLGVVAVQRRGGYFPMSGQASAVLDAMLMECGRLGIFIKCEIGIRSIHKAEKNCKIEGCIDKCAPDVFIIETKTGTYKAQKCILATGGKSYKKTGSDGSGFLYVERFGHHIQDLVPALVPLQSDLAFFKKVAGIRAEISIKIYIDGVEFRRESGELQLTDYGISGICVFQVSSLASRALRAGKKVLAELNFLPKLTDEDAFTQIMKRAGSVYAQNKTMEQCMLGMLADKLGSALLAEAQIPSSQMSRDLTAAQARRLVTCIRHFRVPIVSTRSFEQAQVTAGGVDTQQVSPDTMESGKIRGLYFAGEMLDVDGICGGFNLQWAWSSGAVAGMHAARHCTGKQTDDKKGSNR